MSISDMQRKDFVTLQEAFTAGKVCLMECWDKKLKERTMLICVVNNDGKGSFDMLPFAILCGEDVYTRFLPPDPDGEFMEDLES